MEATALLTEPRIAYRAAQPYVAIRTKVAMAAIPETVPPLWPQLEHWLQQRGLTPAGAPFIRYFTMQADDSLLMEVGFPVDTPISGDGKVVANAFPEGQYVTLTHLGHYAGLYQAWGALDSWMAEKELRPVGWQTADGSFWNSRAEIYPTDPAAEPDPAKWQTDLICLVTDEKSDNGTAGATHPDSADSLREKVLPELKSATTELLQLLSSFSQDTINAVPFAGSWTAAQVGEHVLKSDMGILRALHGEVKPTERPPAAGLEGLKTTFLDFSTKLSSPEFVIPSPPPHTKETLMRSLQTSRSSLIEAAGILDLTQTCVGIPALGEITRLEMLYFVTFHTQRHIHQLKKIAQKLL